MTVNDLIKSVRELFGDGVEYKAKGNNGQVFKSRGYDEREKNLSRKFTKQNKCDFFNS